MGDQKGSAFVRILSRYNMHEGKLVVYGTEIYLVELQIAKVRESTGLQAPKGIQVPHCGADRRLSVKVVISVTITTGEPCALSRQSLLNSLSGDYLDKYHPRFKPLGWYTFMAMIVNGSSRFHCGGAKIIACNALGVCTDTVLASTEEQASVKCRGTRLGALLWQCVTSSPRWPILKRRYTREGTSSQSKCDRAQRWDSKEARVN